MLDFAKKGRFVPDHTPDARAARGRFTFDLGAAAGVQASPAEIAGWRSTLAGSFPGRVSAGVLKQVDDQGIAALQAIKLALAPNADVAAWGLVAASRAIGRQKIVDSLTKFLEQGAWSMSPHIIPHCSLHSVSGLLSQALGLHGPNIGAGGWACNEGEAIWAGLSMLLGDQLPGVWIVFTGWASEQIRPTAENRCLAAALAVVPGASCSLELGAASSTADRFRLEQLIAAIAAGAKVEWSVGAGAARFAFPASSLEAAA
jgi:hypothetical protein